MSAAPLVTVIIPTYQRPGYLKETLEGIVGQTFTDFEVLVISDGPSDADAAVVAGFGDPRLQSLSVEHHGFPAPARNHGMRLARGEFIALCDDDDIWEPNKLEMQLALMRNSDAALCFTDVSTIDASSRMLGLRKAPPRIYDRWPRLGYLALPGYYIPPSTVLVPKSVVDQVGVTDETPQLRGVDDGEWFVRIAYRTRRRFIRVPLPLVRYRSDPSRPGIGLQSGIPQSEMLIQKVKERSGMSARVHRRYSAVQWILRARGIQSAGGDRGLVLQLLKRADACARTVEAPFVRAAMSAQRLMGKARA